MPQVRPYRGIDAAERLAQRRARLIDAGLEILGAAPPAPELTVRTICAGAGVAMRYFYESFSDKDVFVEAVFDHVIAELATTTQAAVAAAPPDEQSRAGMANIVHAIADDPRVGRLLFSAQLSNEVVARKRNESTVFFAMLLGQHAGDALQLPAGDRRRASTHFAVGGVAQTLSAWLSGEITFTPDELIDHLALLLDTLGKRAVRR
ncbi:TetR/AcrR family transcriptional regulator [Mycolicibacterium sp. 141076]|uniref:TetR/AcrR family transcriptional regulator n=1 Tax=Mycobacteriaceae TaxID=1762 RepID=UPI001CFC3CAD|nr:MULTISPECIES: TetR/AcrR family transcriptional regulator [Mycolicibacterium]MDX1877474.1 TetR/AcrR family transcriptional regulator [Mycolicibacterium sp. 141076]UCZ60967.1 TetR/AcrR family transcriptional regulator [Mycolicibacterium phocaicum]